MKQSLACALALVTAAAWLVSGQEPILTFSVGDDRLQLAPGGAAELRISILNESIREADDIVFSWIGPSGFSLEPEPEKIKVLAPFSSTDVLVRIVASGDVGEGDHAGGFEIVYTYCIDDICFQVVDEADVILSVAAAWAVNGSAEIPAVEPRPGVPWRWVLPAATMLLLAVAVILWRVRRMTWPVYVALLIILGGSLAYGVTLRQHEQAKSIGSVLCTSCVGIEESSRDEPFFGPSNVARIEAIERETELIVFFAIWCHSCPFAEAMVELAASHNELISYRFVDVDRQPELAVRHGVVRSARTVVPAIVRVDTGEVIFGSEELEERLVDLLEATE